MNSTKEKTCDKCRRFDMTVRSREYPNYSYSPSQDNKTKYLLCDNCIKEEIHKNP